MEAVSQELYDTIKELQSLPSLHSFALAGGTSLALRYNHRISIDVDLFTNEMVGTHGLETIQEELKKFYREAVIGSQVIDTGAGEQYHFLRAYINKKGQGIKVEILQNMQTLYPVERCQEINVLSLADIGMMKLTSAASRKAKKDIYDLDWITDDISLPDLLEKLSVKSNQYNTEEDRCLFDLDEEQSPADNIQLLLAFDETDYTSLPGRPSHSDDLINIIEGNRTWQSARRSWRRKVHQLFRDRGIPLPPVRPIG